MDQIYAQGKNNGLNFYKKKQFCLVPSRISEYPYIFTEIGTTINLASRFKTVLEDKILGDKWGSCTQKYQSKRETKFGLSVLVVGRMTFSYWICGIIVKIPSTYTTTWEISVILLDLSIGISA